MDVDLHLSDGRRLTIEAVDIRDVVADMEQGRAVLTELKEGPAIILNWAHVIFAQPEDE